MAAARRRQRHCSDVQPPDSNELSVRPLRTAAAEDQALIGYASLQLIVLSRAQCPPIPDEQAPSVELRRGRSADR
jgi:hypothetical protein